MNVHFITKKNEIKTKPEQFSYYILLAYIVSLYIKDAPVITNILMGLLFCLSILQFFKKKTTFSLKQNSVLAGIIFFYLFQIISVAYSENKQEGLNILSATVPVLIFAITFSLLHFKPERWDNVLYFYASITTIASVAGFADGAFKAYHTGDTGYFYNDNICAVFSRQAVYFAFYISIAIVIFIFQLNSKQIYSLKQRYWAYIALPWLFFILFLLASRTAMFSLILILIFYLGIGILKKKKYMEGCILLLTLVIGSVILIKLFPKTLNRFKGTTDTSYQFDNKNMENHFNTTYDASKWNSSNTRAAIWTCAVEVWQNHPILGTGIGDRTADLQKKFEEKKFWFALTTHKNSHNQYLDIMIGSGLLGLLLFIICLFVYPFYFFYTQKQVFPVMIFLLLLFCLITENMFNRYQGIILISFMLPLSSKISRRNEPISEFSGNTPS